MATIQERTNSDGETSYRVQVRLKGHPKETATFARKTDAKNWAQNTESAIREGRYFKTTEAKRHTVEEMIDRYVESVLPRKRPHSQLSQGSQLAWWKAQIGAYTLADVTPSLIAEKRDLLLSEKTRLGGTRSPSSVVRFMAALSHCFSIAMKEWGWIDDGPMRRVSKPKEPRGRVRFLSAEERQKLLAACAKSKSAVIEDVVLVALCTGMRKMEIMSLKWDAVDLARGMITLHETKNGERRGVPLVGPAFDCVKARNKIRRIDSPYVFPAPYRPGETPKPLDIQSAWDWVRKEAGLDDFRFHDLRHSTASELAMNGATLAEIAEVLGHKTLQMVKRYSHISQGHTTKVLERMTANVFGNVAGEHEEKGTA